MTNRESVSETIRKTILIRKLTGYRIAKDTGLQQSSISRFMRKEMNISNQILDPLCEYLGLELVERKKKK